MFLYSHKSKFYRYLNIWPLMLIFTSHVFLPTRVLILDTCPPFNHFPTLKSIFTLRVSLPLLYFSPNEFCFRLFSPSFVCHTQHIFSLYPFRVFTNSLFLFLNFSNLEYLSTMYLTPLSYFFLQNISFRVFSTSNYVSIINIVITSIFLIYYFSLQQFLSPHNILPFNIFLFREFRKSTLLIIAAVYFLSWIFVRSRIFSLLTLTIFSRAKN